MARLLKVMNPYPHKNSVLVMDNCGTTMSKVLQHVVWGGRTSRSASDAPDAAEAAVLAAIGARAPSVVLAAATPAAREWMPRVAARLGLGMIGDGIGAEGCRAVSRSSSSLPSAGLVVAPIASRTSPLLATIRPGAAPPLRADPDAPLRSRGWRSIAPGRGRDRRAAPDADGAVLAGVRVTVVCAGHGVGGAEGVEQLRRFAGEIGAVLAGTRRVVDAGWLPRARQVGLSGEAIAARPLPWDSACASPPTTWPGYGARHGAARQLRSRGTRVRRRRLRDRRGLARGRWRRSARRSARDRREPGRRPGRARGSRRRSR